MHAFMRGGRNVAGVHRWKCSRSLCSTRECISIVVQCGEVKHLPNQALHAEGVLGKRPPAWQVEVLAITLQHELLLAISLSANPRGCRQCE